MRTLTKCRFFPNFHDTLRLRRPAVGGCGFRIYSSKEFAMGSHRYRSAMIAIVGISLTVAVGAAALGQQRPSSKRGASRPVVLKTAPPTNLQQIAKLRAEYFAETRGLKLTPQTGVEGSTLELQRKILAHFTAQQPFPASRLDHFRWINEAPAVVVGWAGHIVDLERSQTGWLVKVRMVPRLESPLTAVTQTKDYHDEVYEYTATGLRYIRGESPPDPRWGLFFM